MGDILNILQKDQGEIRITAEDVREGMLMDAGRLMQAGLACELVFWLALLGSAPDHPLRYLVVLAYGGAAVSTALGVQKGAQATDMRPAQWFLYFFLALGAIVRLLPIAAFIGRKQAASVRWSEKSRKGKTPAHSQLDVLESFGADTEASQPASIHSASSAVPDAAPAVSPHLWPVAASLRHQALTRLSGAVPRIRLIDTEGHADGALMPPELVMRDLKIPFEVDLSQLELPVTRATKGVFGVQYVVEDGNRYSSVVASDLEEAGLSLDELHRMALANLRRLAKEELKLKRANPQDPKNSALRIKLDGYHETSMLLLDDLWEKALKKYTPNGVVAVMPSRDVCTFIDLAALTKGGLAELREAILQAKRLNGEVVNAILHRQGRNWALAGQVDGV